MFCQSLYHIQRAYEYDVVVYQEIGCLPNCNPEQPNQIFSYSCDVICRLIHEECLRNQGYGHIVKIISGHLSADGFGILFHVRWRGIRSMHPSSPVRSDIRYCSREGLSGRWGLFPQYPGQQSASEHPPDVPWKKGGGLMVLYEVCNRETGSP